MTVKQNFLNQMKVKCIQQSKLTQLKVNHIQAKLIESNESQTHLNKAI